MNTITAKEDTSKSYVQLSHNPRVHKVGENKHDKFLRLANRRLESALDNIALLDNLLQNPYTYDYSADDVQHMVTQLEKATDRIKSYLRRFRDYVPPTHKPDIVQKQLTEQLDSVKSQIAKALSEVADSIKNL